MTPEISDEARDALFVADRRCDEQREGDRCIWLRGHRGFHFADGGRHGWLEGPFTTDTVGTMPNTPGTPRRTIRVSDALWDAAQAKAEEQGTDVSTVIRKALERYVRRTK